MKSRLGTIVVTTLTTLGGIVACLGAFGYFSTVGAIDGMVAACHALRIGEDKQIITTAQRVEVAKLTVPSGEGDEQVAAFFTSDCSKSPFQFEADRTKR